MKSELSAFTIRIPEELLNQIVTRAGLHRRSRNNEIIALLERAIDASVASDRELQGLVRP